MRRNPSLSVEFLGISVQKHPEKWDFGVALAERENVSASTTPKSHPHLRRNPMRHTSTDEMSGRRPPSMPPSQVTKYLPIDIATMPVGKKGEAPVTSKAKRSKKSTSTGTSTSTISSTS
mmetsp:Transcript_6333/g.12181  ORF Transcript_6333/g.12181 Transcript_6333/m.12181 type:complete len:119 (+) Transcript_6333:68-424(+)